MTISSLIKKERNLFTQNVKYKNSLSHIKEEIENLNLIWEYKELEESEVYESQLLKIAGFAEVGPMTSKEIDKEVYKL